MPEGISILRVSSHSLLSAAEATLSSGRLAVRHHPRVASFPKRLGPFLLATEVTWESSSSPAFFALAEATTTA